MKNKIINKILMILKSISIILLLLLSSSIFFSILGVNPNNISDKTYTLYLALSELLLMIILFIIYRKTITEDFKKFKEDINGNLELAFRYWAIGFSIMLINNLFISLILGKTISGNEEVVRSYIDSSPLLMAISTVIFAPINEELTFRKSLRDALKNKWVYALTSGIIFGGLHIISYINTPLDLIYLLPYSSLGISFALLYYKTNNIFSSISMHTMHNLLSIIIYLLGASLIWKNS